MSHEFVLPLFLGSGDPEGAEIALFGVCWDGTSSFKAGSRFAGFAVREASFGMEEFSFHQQRSLADVKFCDYGDLFLPPGQKERVMADIGSAVHEIRARKQFPIAFGGEHLVALPLILAAYEEHPDLALLHFDAHADLRPEMWGDTLSHATIIGRAAERNLRHRITRAGEQHPRAQRQAAAHRLVDAAAVHAGDVLRRQRQPERQVEAHRQVQRPDDQHPRHRPPEGRVVQHRRTQRGRCCRHLPGREGDVADLGNLLEGLG